MAATFLVPEEKPDRASSHAGAGTAEPTARGAALTAQRESTETGDIPVRVVVTDIHMSFGSMVGFMVKLAFATIPAAIIVGMLALAIGNVVERLIVLSR